MSVGSVARPEGPGSPHGRRGVGAHRHARRRATGGRGLALPGRRRAPAVVLHTDRPRWRHAGRPGPTAAAPGPPAGRVRPVPRRLRHGGHDHGPRERPRRGRGLDRHVPRPHPGTRPRPVLPPRVRRSGVGHVVVALRRPPRLDPPHRRRRRGRARARRASWVRTRRRRRSSARIRCGRWRAPRTWAESSSVHSTTASGRRPSSPRWRRPTSSAATGLGCRTGTCRSR